ncbi:MAG TPA: hypothetical protein VGF16_02310 [Bryobacteraceae bacterium]
MLALIRNARRRLLYNQLLSQGVIAVCAALSAFILLLVLGTEILNWYWVILIPAVTFAVALYRVRKQVPPLYVSAQIVDRRMHLADALSTAIYFNTEGASRAPAEIRRRQLDQAEQIAVGLDVRRAIPFTLPRSIYAMVALILVASSLFALRYGLTRRLDLTAPMARILQDALGLDRPQKASVPERKNLRPGEIPQDDNDSPLEAQNPQDDQNQAGDPLEESNDQNNSAKPTEKNSKDQDAKADGNNGDDQQNQGQERASDDENSNRPGDAKDSQNQQSGGKDSNSSNSSSLLSKMRDAVQNLLSSMKQQPSGNNAQQQQQQASQQNSKQKGQQNAGKQQKGEKANGQAGGEEQDPDLSNESQQAENSPGQGNDAQPSNKQPGGGVGNRDGAKDLKQAEQLAAMGKISQIIGKRSANLSGEATVEVQSTVQQLRTAYADRSAQHTDAGGEIGRDEIPAALESYVEQYFEQVHKQPPAKK